MRKLLKYLIPAAAIAAGVGWVVTAPSALPVDAFDGVTGKVARGEVVFTAAGCASCHMAPGAEDEAKLVLAGGLRFPSPFGTFLAPNISTDPEHGIGDWDARDLANALLHGTSPDGQHYFPAFPYTSYTKMADRDVADLWAYMQTLPASDTPSQPHELGFPFNIRRSLGGWKTLFLKPDWVMKGDDLGPDLTRGRYLVEALGHCAECHTPRNALGGLDRTRWMAGAPDPSGKGTIPALTPDKLTWSATDIAYYLETGFTPEFDSAGGHMAHVVSNTAKLSTDDRAAIAAYFKALESPATAQSAGY
ncbi:cytochrome c [Primorskyibacter aestuariivivens]|uniref:c-type cytochrome n=1 Tax=Primorskyibacter aestuariivivens TaxID=1888912 RepID=UPI002301F5C7|nr:cytochrome c [Primorskyibacter aestuariivivens]MDA7426975.1 cytochrome c [Primorskyibacter aestuariivivens]